MMRSPLVSTIVLIALAATASSTSASEAPGDAKTMEVRLKAMSDYLAAAPALLVKTKESHEWLGADEQQARVDAEYHILLWRPDALWIQADGEGTIEIDHTLYYDGWLITLENHAQKVYARAAVPPTVDQMLDEVAWRFDLPIPAADFLYSSPYDAMMSLEAESRHLGSEEISGRLCDRFGVEQADVEWEIWIETDATPLPCRLEIVHKGTPGPARSQIVFTSIELDPEVKDALFAFTATEGYTEIAAVENPPADEVLDETEGGE